MHRPGSFRRLDYAAWREFAQARYVQSNAQRIDRICRRLSRDIEGALYDVLSDEAEVVVLDWTLPSSGHRRPDVADEMLGAWYSCRRGYGLAYIGITRSSAFDFLAIALGDECRRPSHDERSELTALELSIVDRCCDVVRGALETALSRETSERVDLSRADAAPGEARVSGGLAQCIVADVKCVLCDCEAKIVVAVAQLLLEPHDVAAESADIDGTERTGDRQFGAGDQIAAAVPIEFGVAFEENGLTLKDIEMLQVGSVLRLSVDMRSPAILSVDGQRLFRCELGQDDGSYSIAILGAM